MEIVEKELDWAMLECLVHLRMVGRKDKKGNEWSEWREWQENCESNIYITRKKKKKGEATYMEAIKDWTKTRYSEELKFLMNHSVAQIYLLTVKK